MERSLNQQGGIVSSLQIKTDVFPSWKFYARLKLQRESWHLGKSFSKTLLQFSGTNNYKYNVCKTKTNNKNAINKHESRFFIFGLKECQFYSKSKHNLAVLTIVSLTWQPHTRLVMFWISALKWIASPGTYPHLFRLSVPVIGPDLQHKQQRNLFCWFWVPHC